MNDDDDGVSIRRPPPTDPPPEFRGIFGPKGDSLAWLDATSKFPNGVPRFETRDECLKFMREYNAFHGGSNPEFPHLRHIFTTLISWDQIQRILLPAIEKARKEPSSAKKIPQSYGVTPDDSSKNIYEQTAAKPVVDAINFRLNQPFHKVRGRAGLLRHDLPPRTQFDSFSFTSAQLQFQY